jgi:diguanylate cyclase
MSLTVWTMSFLSHSPLLILAASAALLAVAGIVFVRWDRVPAPCGALTAMLPPPSENSAATPAASAPGLATILPIERKGGRLQIAVSDIVSVHANAHYSTIFNGRDDLFCPLPITEIDARLPRRNFFRTHRSYIVNLAYVSGVKRAADAGVAELDSPTSRAVPISRRRVTAMRRELAAFRDLGKGA